MAVTETLEPASPQSGAAASAGNEAEWYRLTSEAVAQKLAG